ncbi:MAG TPA: GAF domain-containing protein [Blastococcus sp.]|nr:GAF domain-containing protein [Blastococcus sp.]
MSISAEFENALAAVTEPELDGPELLPVRLARACARMLPVDGAGISLVDGAQQRVPLGASSEPAADAERLQFTVGEGPCMTSQNTRMPVFAVEEELHRRWPVFSDLLVGGTPYRAVVALPLQPALAGAGAIDLYFETSARVTELDVFEAMTVGDIVTTALSEAAVWSTWTPGEGPAWLQGPVPQRRAAVWEALGKVCVDLEIDTPAALSLLRLHAYGTDSSVDDVAARVLLGEVRPMDLLPTD